MAERGVGREAQGLRIGSGTTTTMRARRTRVAMERSTLALIAWRSRALERLVKYM
jgi:hypothetical protein